MTEITVKMKLICKLPKGHRGSPFTTTCKNRGISPDGTVEKKCFTDKCAWVGYHFLGVIE